MKQDGVKYLSRQTNLLDLTNQDNVVIKLPGKRPTFAGSTGKGHGPANSISMSSSFVPATYGNGSYGSGVYMESLNKIKTSLLESSMDIELSKSILHAFNTIFEEK